MRVIKRKGKLKDFTGFQLEKIGRKASLGMRNEAQNEGDEVYNNQYESRQSGHI